jgi:hypothetical protein
LNGGFADARAGASDDCDFGAAHTVVLFNAIFVGVQRFLRPLPLATAFFTAALSAWMGDFAARCGALALPSPLPLRLPRVGGGTFKPDAAGPLLVKGVPSVTKRKSIFPG